MECLRPNIESIILQPFKENLKVGMIWTHTNMYAKQFECYKGWDGLVIAGTGFGHLPITEIDAESKENAKIFDEIKEIMKSGTITAMATQTIFGQVDMNVYTPGRKLLDAGLLGNLLDMHPETAFVKLAWLLSNYPKEQIPGLYATNMAQEISDRIEHGTFP